jgi:hypothetical protein
MTQGQQEKITTDPIRFEINRIKNYLNQLQTNLDPQINHFTYGKILIVEKVLNNISENTKIVREQISVLINFLRENNLIDLCPNLLVEIDKISSNLYKKQNN